MILRSLAHSIRRQDWFAVAIEFLIVVAGIFVGLQVSARFSNMAAAAARW